jgi:subtilisin
MTMSSDGGRASVRGDGRRQLGARDSQYMIAPAGAGTSNEMLIERLNRSVGVEIVRTYAARGNVCPPVAVVQMSDENASALRRPAAGSLVIEADLPLRPVVLAGAVSSAAVRTSALGPGFTTTIQVLDDNGQAVERAEVELVGEYWTTQGLTGRDGKVELTLYGELPETVTDLLIRPRSGASRSGSWSLWRRRPDLAADAVNTFTLRQLSSLDEADWGGRAMRFDRLPAQCRGAGVKVALIDSGIATSHPQLAKIDHGIDLRSGQTRPWSQDESGHGTPCAGIIGAVPDAARGIRGYAPDAELHICALPLDARCSDLVVALDHCVQAGIDAAFVGFACPRGSAIVEQRIMAAKQHGIALIAAAGNTGGPVQFPACSPHVLAIGAIGQAASFPEDSPQAAQAAAAALAAGGLFVPPFSCHGPELDLAAPGVAVVACQAPDGYAACDGTSIAAAHVAALAALILAHHSDFRRDFAGRDFRRVERLFQILKAAAQPIGHPWQTGAGLPDAARALGFASQAWSQQAWPQAVPLEVGLGELRNALRRADVAHAGAFEPPAFEPPVFEPPRGPAVITQLPLNPLPTAMMMGGLGGETGVHALRSAMMMAGLATAR